MEQLTDVHSTRLHVGDTMMNSRGWTMKLLDIGLFCCRVVRVGTAFKIFRESIKRGGWCKANDE